MEKSKNDVWYVVLFLSTLFILDLFIIAGIFWHGKANFVELIKHLKS